MTALKQVAHRLRLAEDACTSAAVYSTPYGALNERSLHNVRATPTDKHGTLEI